MSAETYSSPKAWLPSRVVPARRALLCDGDEPGHVRLQRSRRDRCLDPTRASARVIMSTKTHAAPEFVLN
jgi:hypothetical protein